MKYIIPLIPPSLNKYAGRENQWDYRAAKSEWKQICRAYCRPSGKPPDFADVRITFYFPDRRRHDPDNYCKLLLDGLVYAGVIADDDFGHIRLSLSAGVDKKNPRVEVDVNEVQPTVDAVEVVRCKDCKHLIISGCYGACSKAYLGLVSPYDFCSHGKKKK